MLCCDPQSRHSTAVPNPAWQTALSQHEAGHATGETRFSIGQICNGTVKNGSPPRFVTSNGWMFRWKKQPDLIHIENGKTIKEVWKDVPPSMCPAASLRSASSTPQVSNLGRVRRQDGSITMGYDGGSGYRTVGFKGGRQSVHRLVCAAFIGPPSDALPTCDHIDSHHYIDDEHPFPNRASNVRWVKKGC